MNVSLKRALQKTAKGAVIAGLGAVVATLSDPALDLDDGIQWQVAVVTSALNAIYQLVRAKWQPSAMVGALLLLSSPALGQNLAPSFSYGPSVPFFTVRFDSIGSHGGVHGGVLNEGAGISFNRNFLPTADGTIRQLTLGTTVFANFSGGDPSTFSITIGETIGWRNNLLAIGPALRIVDVAPGRLPQGVFANGFKRENIVLLISLGFNMGGGDPPPAVTQKMYESQDAKTSPPPNYIRF